MRSVIIILLIFFNEAQAQVTNIEGQRVRTDTVGWAGEVNTGFKWVKETGSVFESETDIRVQYKRGKNLYLGLMEYNWSGANGNVYTHNSYLHLRYNRKLNPEWLRWEVFTQAQFNKITRIHLRYLNGTGPRFKILGKEKISIYFGTLYMFEYAKELDLEENKITRKEHRLSSYFSYSLFPTEQIALISTTYYQPRFDLWSDYRISHVTELKIKVLKHLNLGIVYKLNFDTYPAPDISKVTQSFENKIGIEF